MPTGKRLKIIVRSEYECRMYVFVVQCISGAGAGSIYVYRYNAHAHTLAASACAAGDGALPSPVIKYWTECLCASTAAVRAVRPTDRPTYGSVLHVPLILFYYCFIFAFAFCIIYTWGHILSERKSPEHTTNWSSFFFSIPFAIVVQFFRVQFLFIKRRRRRRGRRNNNNRNKT